MQPRGRQAGGHGRDAPYGLFVALRSVSPLEVLNGGGPTKWGAKRGGRIPVTVATLEWFGSCDGARSAGSGTTGC